MGKALDLSGQTYGRLRVLTKHPKRTHDKRVRWECLCECGTTTIVTAQNLRKGRTRSCGCLDPAPRVAAGTPPPPHMNITPTPIGALDDRSTDALCDAVHGLPEKWRVAYLNLISDELLATTDRPITLSIVERVCTSVRCRMLAKGRRGNDEDDRVLERRLA